MAKNKESVDSIKSFSLESDHINPAPEPQQVEIMVGPKKQLTIVDGISLSSEPEKEPFYMSPAIQEALSFNLSTASKDGTLENNRQLRYALCKTIELLKEKTGLCRNLEKQIMTLELQTTSLGDLVSIIKELLSARNVEVAKLHDGIRKLEDRIDIEREKHRHVLLNMNETVKVITKMKEGHRLHLDMTTETEDVYRKKIKFLEEENRRLSNQIRNKLPSDEALTEKVGEGDNQL